MKMTIAPSLLLAASTLLAIAAPTAHADAEPAPAEPVQLDPATVPDACKPFLTVPSDARSELMVWNQRVSLAGCLVNTSAALPPAGEARQLGALVASLDDSVKRATGIYRDAMAHAPRPVRMLAAFGLGSTLRGVAVRARSAIPPSSDPVAHLALHQALEPLLASDLREAAAAFAEVDRLAREAPADAAANPVLGHIVAAAREAAREELHRR